MSYFFTKTVDGDMGSVIERVTAALQKQGFGVLTDIDVKATLKKKLDVDFREYRILGACNPPFAYKALKAESDIGTMLPCNVVLQEMEKGRIRVSAIDPVASMIAVDNNDLHMIASEVRSKLETAIRSL
jgi:uncharacterized protein (DUF302 family)